jgi:hypothetical protein
MTTSESSKHARAALADAHVLQREEVLLPVFEAAGFGDWFYLAAVCTRWRDVYRAYCEKHHKQTVCAAGPLQPGRTTTTWYTSAFASLSKLQLACSYDLVISLKLLPQQAGRSADKQTLLWAKQRGLLWDVALSLSAAQARRFELLCSSYETKAVL